MSALFFVCSSSVFKFPNFLAQSQKVTFLGPSFDLPNAPDSPVGLMSDSGDSEGDDEESEEEDEPLYEFEEEEEGAIGDGARAIPQPRVFKKLTGHRNARWEENWAFNLKMIFLFINLREEQIKFRGATREEQFFIDIRTKYHVVAFERIRNIFLKNLS